MSELKLGQIIEGPADRDAIHVAVAPVVAGVDLEPGQHVGLFPDGTAKPTHPHIGIVDPYLRGRVNRGQQFWLFLYPQTVTGMRHEWQHPAFPAKAPPPAMHAKDERHAFLGMIAANPDDEAPHRVFADWLEERGEREEAEKHRNWKPLNRESSEAWLREFCKTHDCPDYGTVMDALRGEPLGDVSFDWGGWSGQYLHFNNVDAHSEIPDEFWDHVEVLLGRKVDRRDRATGFSCSC
jgi:uncharacterized protein (TIGR02996 family)